MPDEVSPSTKIVTGQSPRRNSPPVLPQNGTRFDMNRIQMETR
jgi:hypothetical protein